MNQQQIAIVDIGSSTVKYSVYSKETKELLEKDAVTTNLAEEFEGELKYEAMVRTATVIKSFIEKSEEYQLKVIGTGVLRKASNTADFIDLLESDVDIEIVSGEREAELIFIAVETDFDPKPEQLVVVNAGGGSTEVITRVGDESPQFHSLPIGISRLNEQYLTEYPVSASAIEGMKTEITSILASNIKTKLTNPTYVYTGGELKYMQITDFPLVGSEISDSHPKQISIKDFTKHASVMAGKTLEDLHEYMPDNPKWMNGAIASNVLLGTIAEYFEVETIVPSNMNLNDGVIETS